MKRLTTNLVSMLAVLSTTRQKTCELMSAALAAGVIVLLGPAAVANTVDFNGVPLGTQYGTPAGHIPGDVVLTQNSVDMSVHDFFFFPASSGSTFNFAEIVAPPNPFAPNVTQALNTNNINVQFDFAGHTPPASQVSLEYVDLGGNENLDINGIGLMSVADFTTLGTFPGFNVNVTSGPVAGGLGGTIVIQQTGANPIQTLLIGGQELGIDNVLAVPEPHSVVLLGMGVLLLTCTSGRRPKRVTTPVDAEA